MGKGIYTYYKERLIEIGGSNKCLYLKSVARKSAYDVGRIFESRDDKLTELGDFIRSGGKIPLSIINETEADDIICNLDNRRTAKADAAFLKDDGRDRETEADLEKKKERLAAEVTKIKELRREVEEIERESGRDELYLGYPFVFGCIQQGPKKTLIKAPLLLFPVKIDIISDTEVEIRLNTAEKTHINHALVYAYAQSKRINVDSLELEFDSIAEEFGELGDIISYLESEHVHIDLVGSKNVYNYDRFIEPDTRPGLSVRYAAVLGRFPLSNSIYNDYTLLEKNRMSNDAVNELLRTRSFRKQAALKRRLAKRQHTSEPCYIIKELDYAQSEVVRKVAEGTNTVIYGPPGTGKSQTIVNIITDSICKNQRVLVVSQKKAALDVVYNRLGALSDGAMYIVDESKEKREFYGKVHLAHERAMSGTVSNISPLVSEYAEIDSKIESEKRKLESFHDTLFARRPFGLSLSEMYSSSKNIAKDSVDYTIYEALLESPKLLAFDYPTLASALFDIRSMNLAKFYYDFMQDKEKNPLIDYMREDLDVTTLSEIKAELLAARKSKKGLFNTARYPYYRQVLAYYYKLRTEEGLNDVVGLEARLSGIPFFRVIKRRKIRDEFIRTLVAIDEFVKEYDCLNRVLTPDGYLAVIDNILRGNVSYVKLVYEALDNYITLRDESKFISSLNRDRLLVLNFAYSLSSSFKSYLEIIDKLPEIRIYHELTKYEFSAKDELAALLEYPDVVSRIERLNEKKRELAERITTSKFGAGYKDFYLAAQNNKDYLYQISKTQKLQPIRRTMEDFSEFLLSLFPCWLLSPENVSSLLPLKKNLFDVVIFDEASQVFIENTIPAVFRGARVVVAGDDKQLRPSATFMKRYLGADIDDTEDPSLQAALEVDSLLDLAKSRFDSAHLCYHYRSKHSELIDFSNRAFYSSSLQIAPNVTRGAIGTPIERYKVDGVWEHRHNTREAEEVVRLLENILKKRKEGESIGIITFNSEQQSHINDLIDKRAEENADFRTRIARERSRVEGGEDVSLFVKNLENVQGDERDIIIFSVGYARNSEGKLHASFGSLSADGGENRLNVAITRAKSRVIIVTSIEPEELHVEDAKNRGPRLLQKYLAYARSVAAGQTDEASALLSALSECDNQRERILTTLPEVEEELKERLTKLGYTVYTKLGTEKNRISLAVYDKEYDRYLVGVELDSDAFLGTDSTLERDVYKPKFLKSRGWRVIRIWCRDFWLSPTAVVKKIAAEADRAKGALAGTETPVSKRKTKRA